MDSATFELIFIAVLIIMNGIFSAGEMAIVSSRKSKIKELIKDQENKRAEVLLKMKENPEKFLSAVQVGITLFGTLSSAIGGVVAVTYLLPAIKRIPFVDRVAEPVSIGIMVVVLTYLFLVVGELVPKYIGINYRERVALFIVPVFDFTCKIFFFVVNFLTISTMLVVKTLNLKKTEEPIDEGEIKILLQEGRSKGAFNKTEEELIHGVFDFVHRSVKEIMVPRPNVYAINVDDEKDRVLDYIVDNEFSRYPVYSESPENIIGVVYHKDIVKHLWKNEPFNLKDILKRPFFVPDTMEISILLKQMQRRRLHLAIVVDEYGTTVGIVTLEDIIEEIFGEIMDETDVDDRIERLSDGSLVVDASCSIRDINNMLKLNLKESPDYETLGGFILSNLQGVAKGGEIIFYEGNKFTVVDVECRRIKRVKFERSKKREKKK